MPQAKLCLQHCMAHMFDTNIRSYYPLLTFGRKLTKVMGKHLSVVQAHHILPCRGMAGLGSLWISMLIKHP